MVFCGFSRHKGASLTTKLYAREEHMSLRCICISILASEHWWLKCHFQSPMFQDSHRGLHGGVKKTLLTHCTLRHCEGHGH